MIRIDRGDEPPALVDERRELMKASLKEYRRAGASSETLKKKLDQGYGVVRSDLWERQSHKCAYCERLVGVDGTPIDHFRPKKMALRADGKRDVDRYWWLAWTWSNLFLVCATCNSPKRKGNHFPLRAGSAVMPTPPRDARVVAVEWFDTSCERALLLDPSDQSIDPLDHMRWLPIDRGEVRSMWRWWLKPQTPEGHRTVEVLGLRTMDADINNLYRDVFRQFKLAVEDQVAQQYVARKWDRLCRELLSPSRPFLAATWSMLDVLRDSTERLRRAKLPPPPRPGPLP